MLDCLVSLPERVWRAAHEPHDTLEEVDIAGPLDQVPSPWIDLQQLEG